MSRPLTLPLLGARGVDAVATLEAAHQPWCLVSYPYTMRGLPEFSGRCYEIIIWQTATGDRSYASLEVDRRAARAIIEEYGLTLRRRDEEEHAEFWAKDDRFARLHREYAARMERFAVEARAVHAQYLDYNGRAGAIAARPQYYLRRCALRAIRTIYKEREAAINAERDAFRKDFLSKHNIIIYQI